MYTQCPDCGVAFRVSAKVLKQAAGDVRCGGCGQAFNALDNLSEKMPADATEFDTNTNLPELTPEISQSISAAQSAALLKTLDELAGADVRIEDTGVEWRVVDDAEDAESATEGSATEIFASPGESNVDELLVESATPVDEVLSATIVETSIEELRFDDNTPLPEDFGQDDESSSVESVKQTVDIDDLDESEVDDALSEITLSEPGEWEDILDEFDDVAEEDSGTVRDIVEEDEGDTAAHNPDTQEPDELTSEDSDEDVANDAADDQFDLAPQTEEEISMNMMIDQELLSLATEDKDGFASTIVIAEEDAEDKAIEEPPVAADELGDSTGFEEIVMEGEVVRTTLSDMKRQADMANAADLLAKGKTKANEAGETKSAGINSGMIGGLVVLILLLVIQVMHQSREALATMPTFNGLIGPIYRALGRPLQPAWDITGWRFEATKGSTDQNDSELTIYSRIGNKSDGPLPYPLIGISLTDRFEETIGSRVLDPAEYLANDLDPRKLVQPGNTFNAVISIQSPSDDATGFKLNVCYRLSGELLRCAIEDFK
ncbi:MAG: zinc-ribbon domain-containing protein [Proteobacteria bacterium]|nr:zinc-ribbon domain-containing protein [Pseudomonadota bacterium]